MKRFSPFIIIALVAVATVAGGFAFYRVKVAELTPMKLDKNGNATAQAGAENAHVRGPENARVTIEEFGDFQCPPCGILAPTLQRMEHDFPTQLRVIFRNFPLAMHTHAMEAARAAEAAGLQGKFWEMHDVLFRNQALWSREAEVKTMFMNYAQEIGLDLGRFERDWDGPEVLARVNADVARGASVHVPSTPSLFINNQPLPPPQMSEPALRAAIEAAARGEKIAMPTPTPIETPTPAAVATPSVP